MINNKKKKNLSPYAVRILRMVQKSILKYPKLYDQLSQITECGSPMCILGWADFHSKKKVNISNFRRFKCNIFRADSFASACAKLEISENCGLLLWDKYKWPRQFIFGDDFGEISAKTACARIDHFIETDGRE